MVKNKAKEEVEEENVQKKKEEDEKCNKAPEEEEDAKKKLDDEEETEKKADDDEEEEEEKKKKKKEAIKGEGSSLAPQEAVVQAQTPEHTLTPRPIVGTHQDVFVPNSSIGGAREQSTPMGKSAEPDLMKSPLWLGINKQLDGIQDALGKKIDALEKSVNDRLANVKKDMEAVNKFYSQSFHKAIGENVGPETIPQETIQKQLESGKLRFSQ